MDFLKRIHEVPHAPKDTYIFYNLNGGIYYLHRKDYAAFAQKWVQGNHSNNPITMDLAACQQHSVIFDFDFKRSVSFPKTNPSTIYSELIESALKLLLLPSINNFTYILAARHNNGGIHIHLPELRISYDDYIVLCKHLQPKLSYHAQDENLIGDYKLDILTNAMLPGTRKPGLSIYKAFSINYVDELNSFKIALLEEKPSIESQVESIKSEFKRRKSNTESLFRKFLFLHPSQYPLYLKQYMMPVATPFPYLYKLSYDTTISTVPTESPEHEDVATFSYKRTLEAGFICKGKQLLFDGSHFLKTFQFLRFNAFTIDSFQTNNFALKRWYKHALQNSAALAINDNPLFMTINQELQEDNGRFVHDPNPIKTILQYHHGYYFLPVFYALCNHLSIGSALLVQHLRSFLDKEFYPLLDRIELVDEKHMEYAVTDFTIATIHFCGNNLYEKPRTAREKLKHIIKESTRAILSVTTNEQLMDLVRGIQEHHFPILVLRLANTVKKQSRFLWNYLTESWQEVGKDNEITDHMINLWSHIIAYIRQYTKSGGLGGPDPELLKKFSIGTVVSAILSDSNMEHRSVQMDRHRWLIRLPCGMLDLLTGHIGGTAPEFFMSDKKLGIDMPRPMLTRLCNSTPILTELYTLLIDKTLFLTYLKELFLDKTDDLVDTLQELVCEKLPEVLMDPLAQSMISFYAQLCKYLSFEYDLFMYFLDILASTLIATNYERKFFVLKGTMRNGKSKLFELLSKTFGAYYHCIQSENLKPGTSSTNALPELASTLFSCRIVTTDELESKVHENRIKQITGNNQVSFRNMYEQNIGGIPTAKVFTTTNNSPETITTEAFRDRVVAIPFNAAFKDNAPTLTSEQVRFNQYPKQEYVVEQSYKGCFLFLYFHMRTHMNVKDGLVHYRKQPECVTEYTKDYLINTDIFNQFIIHMDVQISVGNVTTMNELRSAIRQYLKASKHLSIKDTDLIVRFEDEFGHLRRTDIDLKSFRYTSIVEKAKVQPLQLENASLLKALNDEVPTTFQKPSESTQEDEPKSVPFKRTMSEKEDETSVKRQKGTGTKGRDTIVYYQDIMIKNLKRSNGIHDN